MRAQSLITLLLAIAVFARDKRSAQSKTGEKPTSGLKWISKSEAKQLPNSWWNENLVRRNKASKYASYCRAEVDGCYYPGGTWYNNNGDNDNGDAYCFIITKTKLYGKTELRRNFQMLYNPEGAANYAFRHWPEGTGNTNFPRNVVKSDYDCNLMLGRYNDGNVLDVGMVDKDGYFYGAGGSGPSWYWDNNEYDILIERTATKIELIDLEYGDPVTKSDKIFVGGTTSTSESLMTNYLDYEVTNTEILTLQYSNKKTWSHSIDIATTVGAEIEISTPGKEVTGGAAARFKFESTFSNSKGWGGETSEVHTVEKHVSVPLAPNSCAKAKLWVVQKTQDVPYTAKYRVHYDSGAPKIVKDKGVLKNVVYSNGQTKTEPTKCP